MTLSLNRLVRVKQRRQNPKRIERQAEYRRVQQLYKRNRKRCAEYVINDNCQPRGKDLPLTEQTRFWEKIFTKASIEDDRPINPVQENWNTVSSITLAEVEAALRSSCENAPGPDGISLADMKRVNLKELTALFNIWLITGSVPTRLLKAETVLIPKNPDAAKPGDFRPITVASRVVRVYHRILSKRITSNTLISPRQKAFMPVDGCCENLLLLDAIIRDSKRRLKPLCLIFVDISKAFDSVSHSTILRAMRSHGLPEPLVDYVQYAYSCLETCIRMGRKRSEPILCRQGVRQGDPLSAILFNLVMDCVLEHLDPNIGYKNSDGLRISYLAYADDLILTAASPRGLQEQINRLGEELKLAGLYLNEAKCATMRVQIDGKNQKWIANPEAFIMINEKQVSALSIVSTYKYLGLRTGITGTHTELKGILQTGIERIKRAPLKPQQRLVLLRIFLIPRLNHQLILGEVTASTLESLDRIVRKAVRDWLRLPKDTPKPFFHASQRDGGLGILPFRKVVPVLRKKRLNKLAISNDLAIRWVAGTPGYAKHVMKATRLAQGIAKELESTQECLKEQAVQLYGTCDGKGLKYSNSWPSVNNWVTDGTTLLTGSDFIHAVQVRGNLLPSAERSSRGRRVELPLCEAGCNAVSTLSHISQSCVRTHRLRTARHDSLVDFIRKSLEGEGYSVLVEPIIKTAQGNRKPDLVIVKEAECHIVDVTITSDVFGMASAYEQKVAYYGNEDIRQWAMEKWPGHCIFVGAVVLNWRGALYSKTACLLRRLGIKDFDLKILVVRVLTYTFSMFRHFSRGTTRSC